MIQPAVVSSSSAFDEAARRRHLTRAVVASTVGTTVEWYDFFLYGSAAALVFPRLFFSDLDPALAQILSWVTFYAGFLGRPVGAAVFGHFGDRVGRKVLLVATMLLMGLSTTAIGLVPSYASIGIWGAVLLTMLRLLQGVAVGGEWSGSVLMAGEWAAPGKRGLMTSFPQMGSPLGLILANSALATLASVQDEATFLEWGWRIPFLASLILVGIGLYIRIGILESPVFANIKAQGKIVRAPIKVVIKENWREVALTTLLRTGQLAPYYITTTFILAYRYRSARIEPDSASQLRLDSRGRRAHGDSSSRLPVRQVRPQTNYRCWVCRYGALDVCAVWVDEHDRCRSHHSWPCRRRYLPGPPGTGRRQPSSPRTSRHRAGIQVRASAITWPRLLPEGPHQSLHRTSSRHFTHRWPLRRLASARP